MPAGFMDERAYVLTWEVRIDGRCRTCCIRSPDRIRSSVPLTPQLSRAATRDAGAQQAQNALTRLVRARCSILGVGCSCSLGVHTATKGGTAYVALVTPRAM